MVNPLNLMASFEIHLLSIFKSVFCKYRYRYKKDLSPSQKNFVVFLAKLVIVGSLAVRTIQGSESRPR